MSKRIFVLLYVSCMLIMGAYAQMLSVSDLLKLRNAFRSGQEEKIENAVYATLDAKGYDKTYCPTEDIIYRYKNCRLQIVDNPGRTAQGIDIDAEPRNASASIFNMSIHQYGAYFSVTVYSAVHAQKWKAQLKELGYRDNGNGGNGNQGRDWEYSKAGYPDFTIWNDHGNTYVLSVSLSM